MGIFMSRTLFFATAAAIVIVGLGIIGYGPWFLSNPPDPVMPEEFSQWRQYTSTIGNFQVDMPTVPQHATETVVVPKSNTKLLYNMYAADDEATGSYAVNTIDYPDDLPLGNHRPILDGVMNQLMGTHPDNELKSLELLDSDNGQMLQFFVETPNTLVGARTFIVGQRLYLITVIDKKDSFSDQRFRHFVESFELLK